MRIRIYSGNLILKWIAFNAIMFIIAFAFRSVPKFYLVLSYLGLAQCLYSVALHCKNGERLMSPIIVYDVVMYLFLFGQCIMWIFTEKYSGLNIIKNYALSDIVPVQIFTLGAFFFFHLPIFSVVPKDLCKIEDTDTWLLAMTTVGYILFAISVIPYIVYNVRLFYIGYTLGYMGIYTTQTGRILQIFLNLREFFFPSVLLIIAGNRNMNKKTNHLLIAMVIIDVLVGFYVGSRSDAMMQCLSLALFLLPMQGEKQRSTIFKYILIGVLLIYIANAVRNVRVVINKDFSMMLDALGDSFFSSANPIIQFMGELGGTMATCIETVKLVPYSFPFKYGTSYLWALTWLIPGTTFYEKASMNNWIDNVRYTGAGWGFSTTGEAYFNFGYYGMLLFVILGVFVGKHFKRLNEDSYKLNPKEYTLSFILFNRLLIFSRMDFLSALPSFIYFYLCIKILIYITYKMAAKSSS